MSGEGGQGIPSAQESTTRKPGWYRDRNSGDRLFWNGVAWTTLSDAVTPFTVTPPPAPVPPVAPPEPGKIPINPRTKVIGASVAAVVVILAIVLPLVLSGAGTTPVSTNGTVPAAPLSSTAGDDSGAGGTGISPFGSTTTNPVATATSTSPVAKPGAATPPSSIPEVPNPAGNVAIVGDSITVLTRADLTHDLRHYNVSLDAISKTTMAEHLATIERIASDGQPRDWVIELGTNDALPEPANPNWAPDFANEVTALQNQRCVVFVTVNPRFGSIATGIDASIADVVAAHLNFHSLDWGDIEFRKPQWLGPDGVHPTKAGAEELAKLEHQAIRGCQGQAG